MKTSNLDQAILNAGYTQTTLAAEVGVSVSTVQSWLRRSREGKGRLPDGERAKALELSLGVRDFRSLFVWDWPEV